MNASSKSVPDFGTTKLITCVLYKGGSVKVLKALREKGINTAAMSHARGSAIGDPVGRSGLPREFSKEVVTVLVPKEQAEEVFEFVFEVAEIDRPHGGFVYMQELTKAVPFALPDVPDEAE